LAESAAWPSRGTGRLLPAAQQRTRDTHGSETWSLHTIQRVVIAELTRARSAPRRWRNGSAWQALRRAGAGRRGGSASTLSRYVVTACNTSAFRYDVEWQVYNVNTAWRVLLWPSRGPGVGIRGGYGHKTAVRPPGRVLPERRIYEVAYAATAMSLPEVLTKL
jgi:hypothetical protein